MTIECPMCSKVVEVSDDHGPRPFCSARCKLADLQNWLGERYRIPAEPMGEEVSDDPTAR